MAPLRSVLRPVLTPFAVVAVFVLVLLWILPLPHLPIESLTIGNIGTKGDAKGNTKGGANAVVPQTTRERPLVLYTYADSEIALANLAYFTQKGLHGNADFIFIFNGPSNATELIPTLPNVRVVERDNTCFDLGAMGEILQKDDLWKKYKRFITMNASIRGPFFPVYAQGCWTDSFLNRITDRVKLVGTSMNCVPRPHVQSMLFATDDVGMSILLDPKLATTVRNDDHWGSKDDPVGLSVCFETLFKAVHSEIGITQLIRSQGYEVDVMLTSVHGANDPSTYCEENHNPDDVLYDGHYFGTSVHPYETIFIKANRGIEKGTLELMTQWHLNMKSTSWDTCGASLT